MFIQDILSKARNDSKKVSGISFDTRTLKKNNIFFAIPGSNENGLKYINLAIAKGASAVVISSSSK